MATDTFAFAYRNEDGTFDVRSMGDSPRMVMVNLLLMKHHLVVMKDATDEQIEYAFEQEDDHSRIVRVRVQPVR